MLTRRGSCRRATRASDAGVPARAAKTPSPRSRLRGCERTPRGWKPPERRYDQEPIVRSVSSRLQLQQEVDAGRFARNKAMPSRSSQRRAESHQVAQRAARAPRVRAPWLDGVSREGDKSSVSVSRSARPFTPVACKASKSRETPSSCSGRDPVPRSALNRTARPASSSMLLMPLAPGSW